MVPEVSLSAIKLVKRRRNFNSKNGEKGIGRLKSRQVLDMIHNFFLIKDNHSFAPISHSYFELNKSIFTQSPYRLGASIKLYF